MAFASRNGRMVTICVAGGDGGADELLSGSFDVIKKAYGEGRLPQMSEEQIAKRFA